jgi:hypothetical protein
LCPRPERDDARTPPCRRSSRPPDTGCAILEPRAKENSPTHVNVSVIGEGYTLLYDLVSKEKQSSLLTIIRKVSPELKSLLERISETSKATATELETLATLNPPLTLKLTHLPRLEQLRANPSTSRRVTRFTRHRRGPGVQHGEFATGSNELRRTPGTQFGRC